MSAYEAIELLELCNANASAAGPGAAGLLGRQTLRGLPFLIGNSEDESIALFGPGGHTAAVRIDVGQSVHSLTFAQVLLDSEVPRHGSPGNVVARYLFHFADGSKVTVKVRERFEIGWLSHERMMRPGEPYLALRDGDDGLQPRYAGPYDDSSRRITEASAGRVRAFFLWPWTNPKPDIPLSHVEITPARQRFVLGGISAGFAAEEPLRRTPRRPVLIELPDPGDAGKPFDLEVEVDRGTATYAQPLPKRPELFLNAQAKGYGEPNNTTSSPAYSEVAATPSANVTVRQGGEALGTARFGDLETRETVAASPRLRLRLVEDGRNWVHTRVVDDETGKPIPCRIHFRSPEGVPYQPYGHHPHLFSGLDTWYKDLFGDVRMDQVTYAYTDGACQGWLPRGRVYVDVARGFEYEPLRTAVEIKRGQRELELRLKRWTCMNRQGWYSGDTHVHFLAGDGAIVESAGEDLNVANVLQSQWGHLFTNTDDFIGRPRVSDDGQTIVYISQENRQHFLGHLSLLGLKRPVMPWCSDGPAEAELGGSLETTLSHWSDAAREQGGLVVLPHFPWPNGEPATLVASGRVDAVEMCRQVEFDHREYYRYLNCGYRLPLVGGTDKMAPDTPVGIYRTYVRIPDDEPFDYDTWCKHLAAGRTFMSSGPIIGLRLEGREIGDTLRIKAGGTLEVEAWAESIHPIHSLQIVQEGRVVAETVERKGARRLRLNAKVQVSAHSWVAARCGGPAYYDAPHHLDGWDRERFAHTSPVYVAVGDEDWSMWNQGTAQYMLTLIEGSRQYVRQRSPQYANETISHHHGEDDHLAYLERPFVQAREAIHRRMHELGVEH